MKITGAKSTLPSTRPDETNRWTAAMRNAGKAAKKVKNNREIDSIMKSIFKELGV